MTTHPPIIGLGMACLDILIRLKDMPTWERGARLNAMAIEGGGPVATALVAAARLGVPTGFVGTYGSDRLGQIKLQTLLEHGLDVSRALQRPGPDDQVVLVHVHAETGERVFSGTHYAQRRPLTPDELDREYLTAADYLHLDGMHADAALEAARWMHEAGKTVMLDGSATRGPVSEKMRALVGAADILICGTGFGPALTGLSDLWDAGAAILDMGPRIVVQTEGKDGSYTVTRDERFHVPTFDVDVVDTTGAGDVFHGAYLVGLLHGWDLHTVAVFSTAVSALKCTQLSGRRGIPTYEETLAFLRQRGVFIG
ncbi:MAG TPA: PfkB family carbohydrate kinase [Anaerolineae bacterium]|nr:PfkB family carbohydrate kinase [Anaerolineae bacterium]